MRARRAVGSEHTASADGLAPAIVAARAGVCAHCGQPFNRGELIYPARRRWRHEMCRTAGGVLT
jgi:hypothetical protein